MHHKRKRPRTKGRSHASFPNGAPAAWNILHHVRPRRRRDLHRLRLVRRGADPDAIAWETGNRRPHVHYW